MDFNIRTKNLPLRWCGWDGLRVLESLTTGGQVLARKNVRAMRYFTAIDEYGIFKSSVNWSFPKVVPCSFLKVSKYYGFT